MKKKCKRCELELSIDCFGRNSSCSDGLFPICKTCNRNRVNCPKDSKVCSRCLEIKKKDQYLSVGKSRRLANYCNDCVPLAARELSEKKVEQDRAYYQREHDIIREQQVWARLEKRYSVTREQYEVKLEEQGGVCQICKKPCSTGQRLVVDHNHDTGQVRSLLCKGCNFRLGNLEDKPWFEAAEAYLDYWNNLDG